MGDEVAAAHVVGPTMILLGFGVELYLKAILLSAGIAEGCLKGRPFGHDLWAMWLRPELTERRGTVLRHAEACRAVLVAEYVRPQDREPSDPDVVPNLSRDVPEAGTFEGHLRHLLALHSAPSGYALRSPNERTPVPEPMLLLCVFGRLVADARMNRPDRG